MEDNWGRSALLSCMIDSGSGVAVSADAVHVFHGNDADAVMEEARAQDCHRDALDAMGCGR